MLAMLKITEFKIENKYVLFKYMKIFTKLFSVKHQFLNRLTSLGKQIRCVYQLAFKFEKNNAIPIFVWL